MKVVTSGGLGDAAMAFAKLFSCDAPFHPFHRNDLSTLDLTHLTNKRGRGNIGNSIEIFYKFQGINPTIIYLDKGGSTKWLKQNTYDYYLGSSWCKDNGDLESWDINPFPPIKFNKIPGIDVIISPISQWDMGRVIQFDDLKKYVRKLKRAVTYVGWAPLEYAKQVDTLPGKNLLNWGNINDLTNLIGSSKTVVGLIGYVTQMAGLMHKEVIWTGEVKPNDRFHPVCDSTYISKLA